MLNHKSVLRYFYFHVLILGIYIIGVKSLEPAGRLAHSSVLVGSRLYFFGGYAIFYTSDEALYIDLKEPFNATAPPFDVSSPIPVRNSWTTTALVNDYIYLFGGIMRDVENNDITLSSFTYRFNTNSEQWDVPAVKGNEFKSRRNMKAVVDDTGKIYLLGGFTDNLTGSDVARILYDLITFNTNDLTFDSVKAPIRRDHYTATMLPDGKIVFIGGREKNAKGILEADINRIVLYDTKKATWSAMNAISTGRIDSRYLHSAVFVSDNRIIICGGSRANEAEQNFRVTPDIAVLNTQKIPFEWTVPKVSSNIDKFPSLAAHTANLVGYYMIVGFGNITLPDAPPKDLSSSIYLMDIRNYTWVNTFEPLSAQSPLVQPLEPSILTLFFIIISGIIIVALISSRLIKKESKIKEQ